MRRFLSAGGLLGLTALMAVAAPFGTIKALNQGVSQTLQGLPGLPRLVLDVVWPVGALPVVAVLLLVALFSRPTPAAARLRVLGAFVGLGIVELALKHFIPTTKPPGPEATVPMLEGLQHLVDVRPQNVADWLTGLAQAFTGHHLSAQVLRNAFAERGTFPSGHVARLAFLTAFLAPLPRLGLVLLAGLLAGLAVVATGGHWFWDAFGGVTLALGILCASGRLP